MANKYVAALHLPSGEIVTLADVNDSYGNGWQCPTEGCTVPLKFTPGKYSHRAGHRFWVSAFWSTFDGQLHIDGCSAEDASNRSTTYFSNDLGREIKRSDTVLLSFGKRTMQQGGSKLEPRRGPEYGGDAAEYAGRSGTLGNLLSKFAYHGGHDGMRKYFYTHDGRQYTWDDIAYASTVEGHQRLERRLKIVVNDQESWPWIVGGTIGKAGKGASNGRLQTSIYVPGSDVPLLVYCDGKPELIDHLSSFQNGDQVVVLLNKISMGGPNLASVTGTFFESNELLNGKNLKSPKGTLVLF